METAWHSGKTECCINVLFNVRYCWILLGQRLTETSKFNGLHADKARKYETDMGTQFQRLSGMLEGLVLSREESTAAANVLGEQNQQLIMQQNRLAGRLDRQERLIKDAIQLCAAGLQETVKTTQSSISMKSMNDARQMLAVCDGDSEFIKDLNATFTAQDRSMQVGFTNDPEFALKFLLGKRNWDVGSSGTILACKYFATNVFKDVWCTTRKSFRL